MKALDADVHGFDSDRFIERFKSRVDTSGGANACWPWTGWCNANGYGFIAIGNHRSYRAHRIAYYLAYERWPNVCSEDYGRRPMHDAWVRAIRDQCVAARVPFFLKQRIESGRKVSLPLLDGKRWAEFPEEPHG